MVSLQCQLNEAEIRQALEILIEPKQVTTIGPQGAHQLLFSSSHWERLTKKVTTLVQNYHSEFPLRQGIPKNGLKSQLKTLPRYFDSILRKLTERQVILEKGAIVSLPSHSVKLSPQQQTQMDAFIKALAKNPYYPPADLSLDSELLNLLLQEKKVIKVGEGVIFSAPAYEEMLKRIVEHLHTYKKITVAEVRDLFQTSRKYALALMEYLDGQKITHRIGDERVLR